MVLLFVDAGVVRIGPPVNGGPVVLAPDPGGCRTASPHSMARRRDVGRNLNRRISAPARSAPLRAGGQTRGEAAGHMGPALPHRPAGGYGIRPYG